MYSFCNFPTSTRWRSYTTGRLATANRSRVSNSASVYVKRYEHSHTTPLLREMHWLQVPERIQFRLCVLVYRCLNGTAPPYLAETLRQSTDVDACRRLRSAATSTLIMPSTRRVTLGDRAFPVAAARSWNGLPSSIRAASSLQLFC